MRLIYFFLIKKFEFLFEIYNESYLGFIFCFTIFLFLKNFYILLNYS